MTSWPTSWIGSESRYGYIVELERSLYLSLKMILFPNLWQTTHSQTNGGPAVFDCWTSGALNDDIWRFTRIDAQHRLCELEDLFSRSDICVRIAVVVHITGNEIEFELLATQYGFEISRRMLTRTPSPSMCRTLLFLLKQHSNSTQWVDNIGTWVVGIAHILSTNCSTTNLTRSIDAAIWIPWFMSVLREFEWTLRLSEMYTVEMRFRLSENAKASQMTTQQIPAEFAPEKWVECRSNYCSFTCPGIDSEIIQIWQGLCCNLNCVLSIEIWLKLRAWGRGFESQLDQHLPVTFWWPKHVLNCSTNAAKSK